VACPEGLEPPTCCLEGNCSIQLSYGQPVPVRGVMVGATRFERATYCSQSSRATKLRYAPTEHILVGRPANRRLFDHRRHQSQLPPHGDALADVLLADITQRTEGQGR
jgi:hypothetical protein